MLILLIYNPSQQHNKKEKIMTVFKKTASVLGTLLVATTLSVSAFANSSVEQLQKNGKVRIGVFSDKPPFGYVDKEGKNQGFDVEIAKAVSKDLLGNENAAEFVLVEAANRVEYLQSNKVDIILANFTVTPARKEVVDFAKPYMQVALGVVSKDGAVITDVKQLEGKTLLVNKGTTADAYFTKNFPNVKLLKFEQNTETFEALRDGRADALAHDNTLLFAWAKENPGFTVGIKNLGDQDFIAAAVKKGNTSLLNWLDAEFEKLGKSGQLKQAYDKTLLPVYGNTINEKDVLVEYK